MPADWLSAPRSAVSVDVADLQGPLETWRHALGHGGVNALPLPGRVVAAVRSLRPRLIRVFIQEFFSIYRGEGQFDWSRLAPYMDALERTGAKLVAALTIKPRALFPRVDQCQWRPRDEGEWQRVVAGLVRRYSVERSLVTHWEIGNEPDIGEAGGCPYLITDPEEYGRFYSLTARAVVDACPNVKVGGPAVADLHGKLLPGFLRYCGPEAVRLDFVSWHIYANPAAAHGDAVRYARGLLEGFPGRRPELMVTEWNGHVWGEPSVEDSAFDPCRAARTAASIIEMLNAGLDWSFYYHIWDQVCFPSDFAPFFSSEGVTNMVRHWNEVPHRLGLFGVGQEVRPQYFVYQMLSRLGEERLAAEARGGLRVLAARAEGGVRVLAVNLATGDGGPRVVSFQFANLSAGLRRLIVYRLDDARRWRQDTLELEPVEERAVYTPPRFECQVFLPADSVAMVVLKDGSEGAGSG